MTFTMKRATSGYARTSGGIGPLILSPGGQKPVRRALPPGKERSARSLFRGSADRSAAPAARASRRLSRAGSGRRLSGALASLRASLRMKPLLDAAAAKPGKIAMLAAVSGGIALFLGLAAGIIVMSERAFPRMEGAGDPLGGLAGADLLMLLDAGRPDLGAEAEAGMVAPDISPALSVQEYVLKKGDTIDSIAKRFGLSRDSVISMNGITNAKYIVAGTALKLPNQDGILHRVSSGESLAAIAKRYKVEVNALLDANNLESYALKSGQNLFIPGAKLDKMKLREALGDLFAWPVRGRVSSPFGYRIDPIAKVRRFHYGIDLAGWEGMRVNSAMEGRIIDTGYNGNFGNYVIIAHSGGFQTAYAHLSVVSVSAGTAVVRGQKIGEVGNTGYSTGSHLHFSMYRYGKAVNPVNFLSK